MSIIYRISVAAVTSLSNRVDQHQFATQWLGDPWTLLPLGLVGNRRPSGEGLPRYRNAKKTRNRSRLLDASRRLQVTVVHNDGSITFLPKHAKNRDFLKTLPR